MKDKFQPSLALSVAIFLTELLISINRKRLKNVAKRDAKQKWDDRHWKDKPRSEMAERDWRIFKEDFNIMCKGGRIPNPFRNWDESDLPTDLKEIIERVGYKVSYVIRF